MTRTSSPRGENLIALEIRLVSVCMMRSGSARSSTGSTSLTTPTPIVSAWPCIASMACGDEVIAAHR